MDVMTEHGEFYSATVAAWIDSYGDLRLYCCGNCAAKRERQGWTPLYRLNGNGKAPLGTPEGVPGTAENVHVITTLAPAAQPHEVEGG